MFHHDFQNSKQLIFLGSLSINEYADVRSNRILSKLYAQAMSSLSYPVDCDFEKPTEIAGSTDQGK